MSSVRKRDNGRWRAQVWVADPISGESFRKTKVFDRQRDAKAWADAIEAEAPIARGTVGEMLDRYMASPTFEPSTRLTNANMAKHLTGLREISLDTLSVRKVERHFWDLLEIGGAKKQGLSPATIQRAYKVLRAAVKNDVRLGYLPRNPIEGVKLPTVQRARPQAVSPEDIERLLAQVSMWPELHAFVRLAAVSGCRRGELVALTWDRVKDGTILIDRSLAVDENRMEYLKPTKTGDIRLLAIDPQTSSLLESMREPSGWVFSDDGGRTHWGLDVATQRVRSAAERAGVHGTIRGLRHSVATHLLRSGMSPVAVAHQLGHANPAMTMNVYAEHVPTDGGVAAQLMASRIAGV